MFRNKADAVSGGANLEQERDIKYIAGIRSSRCSGLSINACDSLVKEQLGKEGTQATLMLGGVLTGGLLAEGWAAKSLLIQGATKGAAIGAGVDVAKESVKNCGLNNQTRSCVFNSDTNRVSFERTATAGFVGAVTGGVAGQAYTTAGRTSITGLMDTIRKGTVFDKSVNLFKSGTSSLLNQAAEGSREYTNAINSGKPNTKSAGGR